MAGSGPPYHEGARQLQDRFDTPPPRRPPRRAFAARAAHLDVDRAFIERMDMFFLATADAEGRPQCSYKGGDPGFVRVARRADARLPELRRQRDVPLAGQRRVNPHVGLLFIDFERPSRLRLNGDATIDDDDPLLTDYPGRAARRPGRVRRRSSPTARGTSTGSSSSSGRSTCRRRDASRRSRTGSAPSGPRTSCPTLSSCVHNYLLQLCVQQLTGEHERHEARRSPPHHDDHRRRPEERRVLRRRPRAAAGQEDRQLRPARGLPPVLRRRARRARIDPHLVRVRGRAAGPPRHRRHPHDPARRRLDAALDFWAERLAAKGYAEHARRAVAALRATTTACASSSSWPTTATRRCAPSTPRSRPSTRSSASRARAPTAPSTTSRRSC